MTMDTRLWALESFRDKVLVLRLAESIARLAEGLGPLCLMHVCGTHERSVNRFGLRSLLPANLRRQRLRLPQPLRPLYRNPSGISA